ncbi:MAG TPA: tetratricopeptide repeat protein [Terracidiphilus sp.]|nr:tetratricopeptide repeat protein [Terracidiphilus sp.]
MINKCRFSTIVSVAIGMGLLMPSAALYQSKAFARQANVAPGASINNLPPQDRGDLLMARREYQAALAAYSSVPGQSAAVLNKMGVAYQHLYSIDKAKLLYERALRLEPRFPDALNNLGAVYFEQGLYKKAEHLYKRALRLRPGNATVAKNLGAAYFAQGKLNKGMDAYRAAFRDDPNAFSEDGQDEIIGPGNTKEKSNQDYCLAALYAQAGMNARAFEYLRQAMDAGFDDYKRLSEDPDFAALRKTPQFAQLMSEERRQ